MALDPVKNFAKVELSTGYASGVTSVNLVSGDGAKLPDPSSDGSFNLVWWNSSDYSDPADDPNVEIVRCTARSTDTLTIIRAQEGTSDVNHNTSGKTYKMVLAPTKKFRDDIEARLAFSSRARVHLSNEQTIPNNTFTKVELDTEDYDGLGEFNTTTHRFTAQQAGYYQVNVSVMFNTTNTNTYYHAILYKNGTSYAWSTSNAATTFDRLTLSISDVVYLAANDFLEVYVYQQSGGDETIRVDTYFSIHRLS